MLWWLVALISCKSASLCELCHCFPPAGSGSLFMYGYAVYCSGWQTNDKRLASDLLSAAAPSDVQTEQSRDKRLTKQRLSTFRVALIRITALLDHSTFHDCTAIPLLSLTANWFWSPPLYFPWLQDSDQKISEQRAWPRALQTAAHSTHLFVLVCGCVWVCVSERRFWVSSRGLSIFRTWYRIRVIKASVFSRKNEKKACRQAEYGAAGVGSGSRE